MLEKISYEPNSWKDPESKIAASSKPVNKDFRRPKVSHYFLWWSKVGNYLHRLVLHNRPTGALLVDNKSTTPTCHHRWLFVGRPLMHHRAALDDDTRRSTPSHRQPVLIPITFKLAIPFKTWHPSSNSCRWTNKATTIATSRKYWATILCPTNHALIM